MSTPTSSPVSPGPPRLPSFSTLLRSMQFSMGHGNGGEGGGGKGVGAGTTMTPGQRSSESSEWSITPPTPTSSPPSASTSASSYRRSYSRSRFPPFPETPSKQGSGASVDEKNALKRSSSTLATDHDGHECPREHRQQDDHHDEQQRGLHLLHQAAAIQSRSSSISTASSTTVGRESSFGLSFQSHPTLTPPPPPPSVPLSLATQPSHETAFHPVSLRSTMYNPLVVASTLHQERTEGEGGGGRRSGSVFDRETGRLLVKKGVELGFRGDGGGAGGRVANGSGGTGPGLEPARPRSRDREAGAVPRHVLGNGVQPPGRDVAISRFVRSNGGESGIGGSIGVRNGLEPRYADTTHMADIIKTASTPKTATTDDVNHHPSPPTACTTSIRISNQRRLQTPRHRASAVVPAPRKNVRVAAEARHAVEKPKMPLNDGLGPKTQHKASVGKTGRSMAAAAGQEHHSEEIKVLPTQATKNTVHTATESDRHLSALTTRSGRPPKRTRRVSSAAHSRLQHLADEWMESESDGEGVARSHEEGGGEGLPTRVSTTCCVEVEIDELSRTPSPSPPLKRKAVEEGC